LTYDRGWDKDTTKKIGKRIIPFEISTGLCHWSDINDVLVAWNAVSAHILRVIREPLNMYFYEHKRQGSNVT